MEKYLTNNKHDDSFCHMNNLNLKDPKNPSGPVAILGHKIFVDRNLCIGAASCIAIAPNAFKLDDENKAVILDTADHEAIETIFLAAQSCPVEAIIIENAQGKRVWPK